MPGQASQPFLEILGGERERDMRGVEIHLRRQQPACIPKVAFATHDGPTGRHCRRGNLVERFQQPVFYLGFADFRAENLVQERQNGGPDLPRYSPTMYSLPNVLLN